MPEFDAVRASAKGVAIRQERALLKRKLADGVEDFLDVFDRAAEHTDKVASGLRVEPFLRCIPAIGTTKARGILDELGIRPSATLGGLRVNQRSAFRRTLVGVLAGKRAQTGVGSLVVIAGPTAVGKATVIREVRSMRPEYELSVSATTRKRRPGERDGRDYFFVDNDEFDRMVAKGELLEWALVHGSNRYGTPKGPVAEQQRAGKTVLLEIDLQGARQIRQSGAEALFIFLAPPSFNALVERLESRGTEDEAERRRRLATAVEELSAKSEFDEVVVNEVVSDAAADIVELISRYQRKQGEH